MSLVQLPVLQWRRRHNDTFEWRSNTASSRICRFCRIQGCHKGGQLLQKTHNINYKTKRVSFIECNSYIAGNLYTAYRGLIWAHANETNCLGPYNFGLSITGQLCLVFKHCMQFKFFVIIILFLIIYCFFKFT